MSILAFSNNTRKINTRRAYREFIQGHNYKYIITLQPPMRNPYRLDSGFERVASLEQVDALFYTIERNADFMGYHCHLFLDSYNMTSQDLAFVMNISESCIWWDNIKNIKQATNYITKHMKGEQIHYNYYINKKI